MRVLEPEDRKRLGLLSRSLPKAIAGPMNTVLTLMIRPEVEAAAPINV